MDRRNGGVDAAVNVCHLQCEISSVTVTGLGCAGGDERALFLRCHVPAGGGRTIQIDSHGAEAELDGGGGPSSSAAGASTVVDDVVSWRNVVASLRCEGSPACVRELVADRSSVLAFEVRRRRRTTILGRAVGSELVGRAEVAWRDVAGDVEAGNASAAERRVALELAAPARGRGRTVRDDAAAPVLSVSMSVRVSQTAAGTVGRRLRSTAHRETSGWDCEWSAGEDVFGVVACAADDAFE